jgi:hypothetical protein
MPNRSLKLYCGGMNEVKVLSVVGKRTQVQSPGQKPYWTSSKNIITITEEQYLEHKKAGRIE